MSIAKTSLSQDDLTYVNVEVGYASVLKKRHKFSEALPLFEHALQVKFTWFHPLFCLAIVSFIIEIFLFFLVYYLFLLPYCDVCLWIIVCFVWSFYFPLSPWRKRREIIKHHLLWFTFKLIISGALSITRMYLFAISKLVWLFLWLIFADCLFKLFEGV